MTSLPQSDSILTIADIRAAAACLRGQAVQTPLLESPALNARLGGRLLVKAEGLQRTGSFKFRGAFNKLKGLAPELRSAGVVAYSSGNHAQGVAAAAQMLGIKATIVMPADAPKMKIDNTKGFGATVVPYDRVGEDRRAIANAIAAREGATLVPPFDDAAVMAGQGTVGLEIAEQIGALGATAAAVLVPCCGGGLTAGIATATDALMPETAVYAVEPRGFDDTARSLAAGERVRNTSPESGFCDALLTATPGELTFAINRRLVAGGLVVDDEAVRSAMATAFGFLKIVVEPSGAVALAAVLSGGYEIAGKTVVVVTSGANVAWDQFCASVNAAAR
jgi:threonine dehydratase